MSNPVPPTPGSPDEPGSPSPAADSASPVADSPSSAADSPSPAAAAPAAGSPLAEASAAGSPLAEAPTAGALPAEAPATGEPVSPVADPGVGRLPVESPAKPGRGRLIGIVGVVVAVLVAAGLWFSLSGTLHQDKAAKAKVGDCVAANGQVPTDAGKDTNSTAEVVDCTASDAAYKVVGRVNGEHDTESKSCDQYFTNDQVDHFIYASTSGQGFLLCLEARA